LYQRPLGWSLEGGRGAYFGTQAVYRTKGPHHGILASLQCEQKADVLQLSDAMISR
jgi:hypothetical protein